MSHFFQIIPLIQTIGLIGIFIFVFAESGLFFGFFLPGDSILFTAGVLASAHYFNVFILFLGCFIFAILGDSFGYFFGKKIGPRIFSKPNSFFWNKNNLEKTNHFFKKYGNKTITLARFVPVVRTLAPIMAGVGEMPYKTFFYWNVLGGLFWTLSMVFGGYLLGNSIKNVDKYILPIVFIIVFLSILPILFQTISNLKKNKKSDSKKEGNIV